MSTLEQLIRFESAHSRLAFRREIYRPRIRLTDDDGNRRYLSI